MAATSEGPWAIRVMWILTALTFVFVLLRNYTRVFVVRSFGIDDHVYNFAFVSVIPMADKSDQTRSEKDEL